MITLVCNAAVRYRAVMFGGTRIGGRLVYPRGIFVYTVLDATATTTDDRRLSEVASSSILYDDWRSVGLKILRVEIFIRGTKLLVSVRHVFRSDW